MEIQIIDDEHRLAALRDDWDRLLADSPAEGFFLTWEWLATWWRHLAGERRLFVVVVRDEGGTAAIAPLAVRLPGLHSVMPFPYLEFLGTGSVGSDYLDLIVKRGRERQALAALAEILAREKLLLELEPVRSGQAAAFDLARLLARRGWTPSRDVINECRFVTLAGHTFDSYLAGLGPAHRANFRRRLRALERRFRFRFRMTRGEEGREAALEALIALHRARWGGRGVSNAFHTAAHVAFHHDLSRLAAARGWLRIGVLELDGAPRAALYGFLYRDVFYFYQSGFDPEFAPWSVGLVAMGLSIRSALEEGACEFDMLQGVEGYKLLWARQARELARLEIYPPQLRGSVLRGAVGLTRVAKRAARGLLSRPLVGRLVAGRTPQRGK